ERGRECEPAHRERRGQTCAAAPRDRRRRARKRAQCRCDGLGHRKPRRRIRTAVARTTARHRPLVIVAVRRLSAVPRVPTGCSGPGTRRPGWPEGEPRLPRGIPMPILPLLAASLLPRAPQAPAVTAPPAPTAPVAAPPAAPTQRASDNPSA